MAESWCPQCGKGHFQTVNFCDNCGFAFRSASPAGSATFRTAPATTSQRLRKTSAGSCREDILNCVARLLTLSSRETFTVQEVLDCMRAQGTRYAESTIRTHVTSVMCANAPKNHGTTFTDFVRVGHGTYRLAKG